MRSVKIGELEVPFEYFDLSEEERNIIIDEVYNSMLLLIDRTANPAYNRKEILAQIIESSLITNIEEENYEICQVLFDLKKHINED